MVLLRRDSGTSKILVNKKSRNLTGVFDSLEAFRGTLCLRNGWKRYEDYEALQKTFWNTFMDEFGGEWSGDTRKAIQTGRILGLLLSRGFTK